MMHRFRLIIPALQGLLSKMEQSVSRHPKMRVAKYVLLNRVLDVYSILLILFQIQVKRVFRILAHCIASLQIGGGLTLTNLRLIL